MKSPLFAIFILSLVAFSCTPKTSKTMKPNAPLDNTRWKMVKITGADPFPKLEKDAFIQFDKSTGRYRGNAGCNNFNGSYKAEGNKISLGNAAMTRMFCAGDGMKIEDIFSRMMGTIDSYQINGDHLVLKTGNKIVAEFEALYL